MKGKVQIRIGNLQATLCGGPYQHKPDGYFGIKMAQELPLPCEIDIPTRDFDVPDVRTFKQGLMRFLMGMASGQTKFYVGCMGGIGRTGLFIAGIAKVMSEYRKRTKSGGFDPILWTRGEYIPHAVETPQQEKYIADLDVDDLVEWWWTTQRLMAVQLTAQPETVMEEDGYTRSGRRIYVGTTEVHQLPYPEHLEPVALPTKKRWYQRVWDRII